jgi:hypothetical protein
MVTVVIAVLIMQRGFGPIALCYYPHEDAGLGFAPSGFWSSKGLTSTSPRAIFTLQWVFCFVEM